jgi:acetyl-CoA carboxylase, biotin carboxylase subunit
VKTPREAKLFKRVLIANRGEIAVRVIRACRDLGIETVAVYSDADRTALHVRLADHAVHIGGAPALESYLVKEKILDAARRTGAEAVHPGYGFLAENTDFSAMLEAAGIVFIGPPASAIAAMGDKVAARQAMEKAKVPCVPGSPDTIDNDEDVHRFAKQIGFPIMLKASAGGGGKGMRLVHREEELAGALRGVRSEAKSSFGDDRLYIEKFIEKPRHIEVQVMADTLGNTVHCFERECTLQRRNQKVVEESPSPVLRDDVRQKMGAIAVRAAEAVGYVGAGTIEFLVDPKQNFYFLEMNTRIQVEHPITEEVTGLDLVRTQIEVASGFPLPWKQADLRQIGHAIECRVYAEDPFNKFLPSPGKIEVLRTPSGPGIRDDSGVYEGATVSRFYDPMISKLVAWGPDRKSAIARMKRALAEYSVHGLTTNLAFHRWVLDHQGFLAGEFDTGFIDREWKPEAVGTAPQGEERDLLLATAAIAELHATARAAAATAPTTASAAGGWLAAARREGIRG